MTEHPITLRDVQKLAAALGRATKKAAQTNDPTDQQAAADARRDHTAAYLELEITNKLADREPLTEAQAARLRVVLDEFTVKA